MAISIILQAHYLAGDSEPSFATFFSAGCSSHFDFDCEVPGEREMLSLTPTAGSTSASSIPFNGMTRDTATAYAVLKLNKSGYRLCLFDRMIGDSSKLRNFDVKY